MNKLKFLLFFCLVSLNINCYKLLPVPESDELNLKVPTNVYPPDGAVNVPLVNYDELLLKWAYDGYREYDIYYLIYVSEYPDFKDAYTNSTRFEKQFEVWLDHNTTYYWKIVATYDDFSVSSEVWQFTTEKLP